MGLLLQDKDLEALKECVTAAVRAALDERDGGKRPKSEAVSVPEAAKMLGICKSAAWAAVWNGTIPSVKVGKRVLISRKVIDEMLNPPDGTTRSATE